MKWVKVMTNQGLKMAQAEDDPEKVMDMLLDQFATCEEPAFRTYLISLMNVHQHQNQVLLPKNAEIHDYNPHAFE